MIDRFRQDMKERLDQLLDEAEKLRHALAALDPVQRSAAPGAERSKLTSVRTNPADTSPSPKADAAERTAARPPARRASASSQQSRTAPGATKAQVLSALSGNGALTAGEVAKATGLGRATVSTTLSKLAKGGEAVKAERGYRLPG
jgi:DNA-binding transcriptional ArsR family regulator